MNAKNKTKSNQGKRKAIVYLIIAGGFLYTSVLLGDAFGLLDWRRWTSSNSTKTTTMAATFQTSPSLAGESKDSRINTNNRQELSVPIVDVISYDELAALHLLVNRVKKENKTAAELMGLQRISIHAKREQVKEVRLQKEINIDMFAATKAAIDTENYSSGGASRSNTQQATTDMNLPPLDSSSLPSMISNQSTIDSLGTPINSEVQINSSDLKLNAMVNGIAYMIIKNKPFRNVREGQVLMARFVVGKFDNDLECISMQDTLAVESFKVCLN
ncbi:hypothetical protein M6C35_001877 [Vibrio metschnikovii]|nr:hypothetical protein [Vibrio metschnikovii]